MGCSCKKIKGISENDETKERESVLDKIFRYFLRILLYLIATVLGLIITPIILIMGLFNSFFRKGKPIILPKFLTQHKKSVNG